MIKVLNLTTAACGAIGFVVAVLTAILLGDDSNPAALHATLGEAFAFFVMTSQALQLAFGRQK